ncbi:MAG: glycosyltransferase family 39 protein [Myxococcales bacterium]|nr:glycosyltransferase family 39 protein [Myxococcales bacterium]
MASPSWLPRVLLAAVVLLFVAQVLQRAGDKSRLQPRYDEVSYIADARDFARRGGLWATIGCYIEGRCTGDNRHPGYMMALLAVSGNDPAFFARAKTVTLVCGLLVLLVVYLAARAAGGARLALVATMLAALSTSLVDLSSRVLADVLYAALFVAALSLVTRALRDPPLGAWTEARWMLLAGAVMGVGYLVKGSAHLLLPCAVGAVIYVHRARAVSRPALYALAAAFLLLAGFLLWRNVVVYGNPVHNYNNRTVWMDAWEQVWTLSRGDGWRDIGIGWYLEHHSFGELVLRLLRGLGRTLGVIVYAGGVGVPANPPAGMSTAFAVARGVSGFFVVALGAWGLVRSARVGAPRGDARIAAVTTSLALLLFVAAYSVGSAGVGGTPVRFVIPLVLLLFPYSAKMLLEVLGPALARRLHLGAGRLRVAGWALVLLLLAGFGFAATKIGRGPSESALVPPHWAQTSAWLSKHLRRGERFALPYRSVYSTWDEPLPDTDPRWNYDFSQPATKMLAHMAKDKVRTVLLDTTERDYARYAGKRSSAKDSHGPLRFLGWPRCFHDGSTPSRFLAYCKPR